MTDLSIIIVSYNTKELLINCLDSIIRFTKGIEFEVIVVDNASQDDSVRELKRYAKKHPKIRLTMLENSNNLGFAKANNKGVGVSNGRYILFLNSDTVIHDNLLKELTAWMDNHTNVGLVTPSLKNNDGSLQATGGYFPTLIKVFLWMFLIDDIPVLNRFVKPFHPHTPDFLGGNKIYLETRELDWITGAFIFARKSALDQAGLFDEQYFMYVEDVDLCYRVKKKGWKIIYLPKWQITHFGGASGSSEKTIISEFKELKVFYKKFMNEFQYILLVILIKTGSLLRFIINSFCLRMDKAKIYAKAFRVA
jgi:GT2 family glycosyltransferase